MGNPAGDKSVKDYLGDVRAEQWQAHVIPKQANPFFVDKLTQLCLHLERQLAEATTSIDSFILARDQAYFKMAFFSGDRPEDLGQVKLPEILRFPNDDGMLLNHVWEKTIRDGDVNVFGVAIIRKRPFVPSEVLNAISILHVSWVSISLVDICFVRPRLTEGFKTRLLVHRHLSPVSRYISST